MATETKFHLQNPQSISEMLDHGSISFGRFAAESLEWEKWSVFSHNRCREELEKFKAPGFVAQKKAFFEEYYKKLRAIKALQADHGDEIKSEITEVGSVNDDSILKEEKRSCYFSSIRTLDTAATTESDVSFEDIERKQELDAVEVISNLGSENAMTESLCSTDPDEQTKKHTPKTRNSRIIKTSEITFTKSVKYIANHSKSQGTSAVSGNTTKIGSGKKRDGPKSSETMKSFPRDKIAVKEDNNRIGLSKISTCKAANGNASKCVESQRKPSELCPASTVRVTSSARNRLVTSSINGSPGQTKTTPNQIDSMAKFRRSTPSNLQSSQRSLKETGSDGPKQKRTDRSTPKVERITISAITTPSVKPVHKNTSAQLTNLAIARKIEPRPKTPGWR